MKDDLLSGDVLYMAIAEDGAEQYTPQSCDCLDVIIVMRDHILHVTYHKQGENGAIEYARIADVQNEKYNLRINAPSNGNFTFIKVLLQEDGTIECMKYHFGDRYLFIFANEFNLVVTKSIPDLTWEDNSPIPDVDDSVLFE